MDKIYCTVLNKIQGTVLYNTWSLYDPFGRSYATREVVNIFLHSLPFPGSEQPGIFLNRSNFLRNLAHYIEWSEAKGEGEKKVEETKSHC